MNTSDTIPRAGSTPDSAEKAFSNMHAITARDASTIQRRAEKPWPAWIKFFQSNATGLGPTSPTGNGAQIPLHFGKAFPLRTVGSRNGSRRPERDTASRNYQDAEHGDSPLPIGYPTLQQHRSRE